VIVVAGLGSETGEWFVEYEHGRWLPVEWFVHVPAAGGITIFAMVLDGGRMQSSAGKLRRASDAEQIRYKANQFGQ
jgi:hypothetical protein